MSRPLRAPVLLADGATLPPATSAALDALQPTGAKALRGAQVIRVGTSAGPAGRLARDVTGADPAALAAGVDRLSAKLAGGFSDTVVIASSARPEYAMPAAGWAAKSGDPVLWTGRDALPAATRAALKDHKRPKVFVLGPRAVVSRAVVKALRPLSGAVERVAGKDAVATAIAFARLADGWNVTDPGHGVVIASTRRPLDAAAGAALSASGTYGPLLLVTDAAALPTALQDYLLDIQPGYDPDPVRGVYNHGWLLGDESAVSAAVQSRIDTLLEIQPVDTGAE
jgi:putative cell wall binding repeat protein